MNASPRDEWVCTAPVDSAEAKHIEETARAIETWRTNPEAQPVSVSCIEDTQTLGELIFWPIAGVGLVVVAWLVAKVMATTRVIVRETSVSIERRWLLVFRSRRIFERAAIKAIDARGGQILLWLNDAQPFPLFSVNSASPDARALDAVGPRIQALLGLPSG